MRNRNTVMIMLVLTLLGLGGCAFNKTLGQLEKISNQISIIDGVGSK